VVRDQPRCRWLHGRPVALRGPRRAHRPDRSSQPPTSTVFRYQQGFASWTFEPQIVRTYSMALWGEIEPYQSRLPSSALVIGPLARQALVKVFRDVADADCPDCAPVRMRAA
jgi:hypothetical protein